MTQARFFFLFVVAVLAIYGAAGFWFLPMAGFEGDLTRMAKLPESDFGWTKEQPAVDPKWMQSAAWEDADVLVIGDSFSNAQVWQSVLARNGMKVHTESWGRMYMLCADLGKWIRDKGFKGRHVVIESAEKYLEVRLQDSMSCQHISYHPLNEPQAQLPPVLIDRTHDYSGRLSVGLQTALNQYRYRRRSAQPGFMQWDDLGEVRLVRLDDGCRLFSHTRCQDVLFYQKDLIGDVGENVLGNMAELNKRLAGFDVAWMVIPDKASVYLPGEKKLWNEAKRRFGAPDLLNELRQARYQTMDLYFANNTHVSTSGYLLLGEIMLHRLQ